MRGLDLLIVGAVRAMSWGARRLPIAWSAATGRCFGWVWHSVLPIRRRIARENVAMALGPAVAPAIVREMYLHLGTSFVELFRFAGQPIGALGDEVVFQDFEHLEAALRQGRGVLVLTAHLGNWELMVRMSEVLGRPLHVVTKSFRSGPAQAAWRGLRRGGASLLPAEGSARAVVAALKRNELVGYVLDQHVPPGRAVWVPFFGRPAATSPDLARLARMTGAPVVPVFARRVAGGHVIEASPPVVVARTGRRSADIVAWTLRYTAVVEAAVRRTPGQWLWIHRRWKVPPPDVLLALAHSDVVGRRRSLSGRSLWGHSLSGRSLSGDSLSGCGRIAGQSAEEPAQGHVVGSEL